MIPTFVISPNSFTYYTNKAKKNAPVIKSTRKKAENIKDYYLDRFKYSEEYDDESTYTNPHTKK